MLFLHSIKSTHHTKVLILGLAANKGGISLKQLTLTGDVNNSSSLFNSEVNIKEIKLTVKESNPGKIRNELATKYKIIER